MSSWIPARSDRAAHLGLALALALEIVLLLVDVLTHSVILTTTYLAAPLALAIVAAPRTVTATAALSIVLALLSGLWNDFFLSPDHCLRVSMVTIAGTLAVISARARQRAIEARAETEAARRIADSGRRQLDAMLGSLAEAVTVNDEHGRTIYANEAAITLLAARDLDELAARAPGEFEQHLLITHEDGSPVGVEEFPGHRLVLGESPEPLLTRTVELASGRAYWLLTKATLVNDEQGRPLAVNIIEDVTAVKDAEHRQRFLAQAGQLLASSLDYEQTLERVAELAVPSLADWCAVDLADERHGLRRVALAHVDPEKIAFVASLQERYPPDYDAPTGIGAVLRSGQSELYTEIADERLVAAAVDDEHLRLMRAVGLRSAILVPMRVGPKTIGVMTLVTADSGRSLLAADLAFAEDLALRAAVAVENARLYTERAHTAQTLQDSLLPQRLPELEHFRTAVSYRSGDHTTTVGGDFYDLFMVQGGLMIVLGDVTGKGVQAAALTAMARYSAKTAARFDARPVAVLGVVDDVLREQPRFSLLTLVCARLLQTNSGVLVEIASGGHPLPLLIDGEGDAREVGRGGLVLGTSGGGSWPEEQIALDAGETLLFYTDGATDVRGATERFGDRRLQRAASGPAEPQAVIDRIDRALDAFQTGTVADDRAMLAIQCVGASVASRA